METKKQIIKRLEEEIKRELVCWVKDIDALEFRRDQYGLNQKPT